MEKMDEEEDKTKIEISQLNVKPNVFRVLMLWQLEFQKYNAILCLRTICRFYTLFGFRLVLSIFINGE